MTGEKWLEAQYSVLGSVLIDDRVAAKVLHETSEQDYRGTCLTVFKAIKQLFLSGSAIDPVSVVGVLGSGYQQFILQLMEVTPTAANVDSYIAFVFPSAILGGSLRSGASGSPSAGRLSWSALPALMLVTMNLLSCPWQRISGCSARIHRRLGPALRVKSM